MISYVALVSASANGEMKGWSKVRVRCCVKSMECAYNIQIIDIVILYRRKTALHFEFRQHDDAVPEVET